jgi:peroxiredoxin Q/BCP
MRNYLWPVLLFAAAGVEAREGGAAAPPAPKRPEVGAVAPDFSAPATDGKTIKLSQFKGKKTVVLAFFPKIFTGG